MPQKSDTYPTIQKSKPVQRSTSLPCSIQMQSVGSARAMQGSILKVTMIPQPKFGCIIKLQSKSPPNEFVNQLTISSLRDCICPIFKDIMSKFGKRGFSFKHYKHLYYIFVKVCNLDPQVGLFIHAPIFSFNEIKLVFENGILIHSITFSSCRPMSILLYHLLSMVGF